MTMNKQAILDWCYSDYDGYSERKEISVLRKLLKNSFSFDDAKFTFNAARNCMFFCFEVENGAVALAAKYAKHYDEHIFVMLHSEYGTPQYEKASAGATAKVTCQYDLEKLGRINAKKAEKCFKPKITREKRMELPSQQATKNVTTQNVAPSEQLSLF
jgi:hypothetical protein